MVGVETILEIVLLGALGLTVVHAARLQRALSALRQDRAAMDAAMAGFDGGAREMEAGIARLREAADRAERQVRQAGSVRDDLVFLSERGESLADRLDALVRAGRALVPLASPEPAPAARSPLTEAVRVGEKAPPVRSQAERSLLLALQGRR